MLSEDILLEERLETVRWSCDSIIIPGAACDEEGLPKGNLANRCEAEWWLKKEMRGYHGTIVSGGWRGVKDYRERYRACGSAAEATESSQIIEWSSKHGQNVEDYLPEPYALETLGNLVFSTRLLLLYGLKRPVFISQTYHLYRIAQIAKRWLRWTGIEPLFWIARDFAPPATGDDLKERIIEELKSQITQADNFKKQIAEAVNSGGERGVSLPLRFLFETIPLPSDDLNSQETKWAFEVAVRWLFRNLLDENGELRYASSPVSESEILRDLEICP